MFNNGKDQIYEIIEKINIDDSQLSPLKISLGKTNIRITYHLAAAIFVRLLWLLDRILSTVEMKGCPLQEAMGGREGAREGGGEGGRERGREGGREGERGGRERGREGGSERGREGGREGWREREGEGRREEGREKGRRE